MISAMDVEKHSGVHFADPTCDAQDDPEGDRTCTIIPVSQWWKTEAQRDNIVHRVGKKNIETIEILKLLTQNSFYCLVSRIMKAMSTQPALILRAIQRVYIFCGSFNLQRVQRC